MVQGSFGLTKETRSRKKCISIFTYINHKSFEKKLPNVKNMKVFEDNLIFSPRITFIVAYWYIKRDSKTADEAIRSQRCHTAIANVPRRNTRSCSAPQRVPGEAVY